jgi:hypothetical protein
MGGLFFLHVIGEDLLDYRAPTRDHRLHHLPFKRAPNSKGIAGLVEARLGNRGSSLVVGVDEPLGLQFRQHGANQGSAHCEVPANLVFWQPGSGFQRLFDYGLSESAMGNVYPVGIR